MVILQKTDLSGSGNLNASFKKSGQAKISTKSSATRQAQTLTQEILQNQAVVEKIQMLTSNSN